MPPKKQLQSTGTTGSNSNNWFILLSILLIVLIFLVAVLIYVIYTRKNEPVTTCPVKPVQPIQHIQPIQPIQHIQPVQSQPIKQEADTRENVPVYPNKLPKYNSQEYQQVGILTANEVDKEPIVLPLFARKLQNNRDRWQYYTATDKNHMMRLPIRHDNMKCEDDIGCKEIYDGDTLSVEIYQGRTFTATIYKLDAPKYFADDY
jgi:hypothetical protein